MSGVEGDERAALQDDLLSLLKTTQPSSSDPIVIETTQDSALRTCYPHNTTIDLKTHICLVQITSAFWQDRADLEEHVLFQVALTCDETVDISQLSFASLQLSFSDDRPEVLIKAGDGTRSNDFIDLGAIGAEGKNQETPALVWSPGQRITVLGKMQAGGEGEVLITSVKLLLKLNAWTFELVHTAEQQLKWYTPKSDLVPAHELSSTVQYVVCLLTRERQYMPGLTC